MWRDMYGLRVRRDLDSHAPLMSDGPPWYILKEKKSIEEKGV
jgi:hypothetical protein